MASCLSELRRQAWEFGEVVCPEYKKHISRDDKMAQETILDILKEFTMSNRQSNGQNMYVKKLCRARKNKKGQ